jgi:peptidoglycan/xylan/chitin deacetylase (PgdA/CDA1 family)
MVIKHWLKSFIFMLVLGATTGCNLINSPTLPVSVPSETVTSTSIPITPVPPTYTPFPTSTPTATLTPTPVWVFQSGSITCPILLYHRIAEPPSPNSADARYYMPVVDFQWQMQALKDWGYTTISISLLVEAITRGALLPPRPVVISFDDGDASVYENAYPVMQSFGFTGVMYLVWNYIGAGGYMDDGQIQAMIVGGWEIGSHSMSHPHLPAVHDQVYFEAAQSKTRLQSAFGVVVDTFAYPFGEIDPFVSGKVQEYGYKAAMGLGTQYIHNLDTLFYLNRIEVRNGIDRSAFAALLPWSNQP